jgi:lysozyme
MKYVPGIDVSGWEPNIDWRAVRNSGIKFAFLKATEGIYFIDKTFAQNWVNTKRVGILRGAYHYLRGEFDANQQADLFLKTVQLEAGDFPPVLDIENINNENISNQEMIAKAEIWLKRVEQATGRKPIIYSGPFFLRDRMSRPVFGTPAWSKNYPLWIANYPYTMSESSLPIQPANWQDWKFWQYTDKGVVPGIDGGVDMNYFRGTEADLYAFAGAKPAEPATHNVQPSETIGSIASQYGVAILDLLEANPGLIKEGMILKIPSAVLDAATTSVTPDTPTPSPVDPNPPHVGYVSYTVKSGDNLSMIAARYNTTVEKIVAENRLPNANLISVGQVLKIPTS